MCDSSYYYALYSAQKTLAEKYGKEIKELDGIDNSLSSDFYDDIRNVNNEIDDLHDELETAVRHNATFLRETNDLLTKKEKGVDDDLLLKGTLKDLDEEIDRLTKLKSQAETLRDSYYKTYERKKTEELQAYLASLSLKKSDD